MQIDVFYSVVVSWFKHSDRVIGVDNKVGSINIVSFKGHLEHLWLMHCSFLHEEDNFILDYDRLIDIVIKLYLSLILELTSLVEEVLIIDWISEVLTIFGNEVELSDISPRVEPISHWVHGMDFNILTTSKQVQSVNFLIEMFPIEHLWHPCEAIGDIENREG